MKKRFLPLIVLLVLLGLTACQRDRPVETPQATPAEAKGTLVATATPPSAETRVSVPAAAPQSEQPTTAPAAAATPTAPAPESVAPGAPAGSFEYTVVAGDTLASIAAKFNVTQDEIIKLNSLEDPNKLVLAQVLKIPGAAPAGGAAASSQGAAASGASTGAASASGPSVYVVQSGDTLGNIARRFNTTVAELMRLNNIANPDRIVVGQKLTVPAAGSTGSTGATTTTTQSGARTYVIQSGDTLLSVARRFGVTLKALQAANNITNPDRIYPGQVIKIP
ncbi:MAG: Muramidase-2 precursor [Chloroflexi bacterium ADurb.Bin325]|nr:MAG: Muramidase-2 precursor [Chloroflexi bacterium ADurb.Bin325]